MTQLRLCSCTEGDPLRIPLGQHKLFTGALAHASSSQTLSNVAPIDSAGPLARTDDPRAFSPRHYATQLRKPSLRGRGFYYPASLPQTNQESLRPYIPPGAPATRSPAETIPHPNLAVRSSPAMSCCFYSELPYICDSLLASMLHLLRYVLLLCFSLLASRFSLLYCGTSCALLLASHCCTSRFLLPIACFLLRYCITDLASRSLSRRLPVQLSTHTPR
jgi:hypothetical protein